jgi:Ca2+-transporting ATPase
VVVDTGVHSEVGRSAGLTVAAVEPATPLERRIDPFGRWLVAAALVLFVAVILLGLWRRVPLAELLMVAIRVAISQMVSMVPEVLPVAMTIALAVGMQRMAGRGAIIRRLSAVETLGSTPTLCSDKTGTLTRNEMTVTALWLPGGRELSVGGIGYAPDGALREGSAAPAADDAALRSLLRAAALCNDARLLPPDDERAGWSVLGDATEGALCVLAAKAGIDLAALQPAAPREAECPFDADTRLMATRHRIDAAPRRVSNQGRARSRAASLRRRCREPGAGGACAGRCAGRARAARAGLRRGRRRCARRGRRRAGRPCAAARAVKAAVAECRAAGMRPLMVTGDHKLTGLAIARGLGIANDADHAVDGAELEHLGEAEWRDALPHIVVLARVHPAQKLRIVEALQARGEVVAMTGNGVNDAPALARADVGVAMGIIGTEVAKGAAKIVVTGDDFATIVAAVEQGRVVYGNLNKVILYLFATSIDEVAVLMLALLGGYPLPLLAV